MGLYTRSVWRGIIAKVVRVPVSSSTSYFSFRYPGDWRGLARTQPFLVSVP